MWWSPENININISVFRNIAQPLACRTGVFRALLPSARLALRARLAFASVRLFACSAGYTAPRGFVNYLKSLTLFQFSISAEPAAG